MTALVLLDHSDGRSKQPSRSISKDEEASIFQLADYGLVGYLFKILPDLSSDLERRGFQASGP